MNKSISAIIQEMKHHRNSFMKKSTPYRQLNRAIKQLEKLEKIEQIVSEWNDDVPWVTSKNVMQSTLLSIIEVLEDE